VGCHKRSPSISRLSLGECQDLPKSAIARIDTDGVHLNVTGDEIKSSGWDHPPSESVEYLGHHEEPQA
jgi:hypothetical protein